MLGPVRGVQQSTAEAAGDRNAGQRTASELTSRGSQASRIVAFLNLRFPEFGDYFLPQRSDFCNGGHNRFFRNAFLIRNCPYLQGVVHQVFGVFLILSLIRHCS